MSRLVRRPGQRGNVTLITAFSACLLILVVLVSSSVAQTAVSSTTMQSTSDEAALAAANALAASLNDITVLQAVQWGVQSLNRFGQFLTGAGEFLAGAGIVTAGATETIAPWLIQAGIRIQSLAKRIQPNVDKFVDTATNVLTKAQYPLAIANSTLLAGNNGYLGVMLPGSLFGDSGGGTSGASSKPSYNALDVLHAVTHAQAILTNDDTKYPDPSTSQVVDYNAHLLDDLRLEALHSLWANQRTVVDKFGRPVPDPADSNKSLILKRPNGNVFFISDQSLPLCSAASYSAGDQYRGPASAITYGTSRQVGYLAPDPFAPPPSADAGPDVVGKLIPEACSEKDYLKQLADLPYLGEAQIISDLRLKIAKNQWAGDPVSKAAAIDALTQMLGRLGQMTSYDPNVHVPGLTNLEWAQHEFQTYSSTTEGARCNDQLLPQPYVRTANGATTYEAFYADNPNEPPSQTAPAGASCGNTELPPSGSHKYPRWTGTYSQTCKDYPDTKTTDSSHHDIDTACDFRNTIGYIEGAEWADPYLPGKTTPDYANTLFLIGGNGGGKNLEDDAHLGPWRTDNHAAAASGAQDDGSAAVYFAEFHQVQPNLPEKLASSLAGLPQPTDRWALTASAADVVQADDPNDRVSFGSLCDHIFAEKATTDDINILGIKISIPSNLSAICTTILDFVVVGAGLVNRIFDGIDGVIDSIPLPGFLGFIKTFAKNLVDKVRSTVFGNPPDVRAYHVILESFGACATGTFDRINALSPKGQTWQDKVQTFITSYVKNKLSGQSDPADSPTDSSGTQSCSWPPKPRQGAPPEAKVLVSSQVTNGADQKTQCFRASSSPTDHVHIMIKVEGASKGAKFDVIVRFAAKSDVGTNPTNKATRLGVDVPTSGAYDDSFAPGGGASTGRVNYEVKVTDGDRSAMSFGHFWIFHPKKADDPTPTPCLGLVPA